VPSLKRTTNLKRFVALQLVYR